MTTEGGGFVLKNMTFQQKRTNFVKVHMYGCMYVCESV